MMRSSLQLMHTMNSTEQNRQERLINEKIYKTMTTVGAGNIVLGVIMIVTGIAAGVITIVGGARLLKNKSGLTF